MPVVSDEFIKNATALTKVAEELRAENVALKATSEKSAQDLSTTVGVICDSLISAGAVDSKDREKFAGEISSHDGALRMVHRMGANFMKLAQAKTNKTEKTAGVVATGEPVARIPADLVQGQPYAEKVAQDQASADEAFDRILMNGRGRR